MVRALILMGAAVIAVSTPRFELPEVLVSETLSKVPASDVKKLELIERLKSASRSKSASFDVPMIQSWPTQFSGYEEVQILRMRQESMPDVELMRGTLFDPSPTWVDGSEIVHESVAWARVEGVDFWVTPMASGEKNPDESTSVFTDFGLCPPGTRFEDFGKKCMLLSKRFREAWNRSKDRAQTGRELLALAFLLSENRLNPRPGNPKWVTSYADMPRGNSPPRLYPGAAARLKFLSTKASGRLPPVTVRGDAASFEASGCIGNENGIHYVVLKLTPSGLSFSSTLAAFWPVVRG